MPSTNLLAQAGARLAFDETMQAFLPVEMPERTHAVGAVAGARTPEAAVAQGRLAGLEVAAALGYEIDATEVGELREEAAAPGTGSSSRRRSRPLRGSSSRASAWT